MPTGQVVFGSPRIVRIVPAVICLACLALVTVDSGVDRTLFSSVAGLTLVMAVVLRSRIEIRDDEVAAVWLWTSRRYPREDVARVDWEPGSRLTLTLRNGTHATLRTILGNEAQVASAIHSWLQRSVQPAPPHHR
jgi:hypothetical protein